MDWQARFVAEMVRFVDIVREELDPETGRISVPDWSPRYQYPILALSYLYATPHPANPFHGDAGILKMATAMTRYLVSQQDGRGRFDGGDGSWSYVEWPAYYMIRTCEVLGGALDSGTRSLVERSVERYLAGVLPRPFVHTSFNHEAWRCLDAVAAGQAFGRPEWVDQGTFMARQLTCVQAPGGYWEEGPHHGPSATYNYVMLSPLNMILERTGDEEIRAAVDRLTGFMLRFAFPDGTTPGCFDGRQSTQLGMTAAGFCRTALGRRMNAAAAEVADRLGLSDPLGERYSMSNWNAHAKVSTTADRACYWRDGDEEPLPQESDGYCESARGELFDGGIFRAAGWCPAVSGYVSDVPHIGESVYRLERASRVDIWREGFGPVVGGGSNHAASKVPLANVHMVTGYGAGVDFGLVEEAPKWDRQGNYLPRAGRSEVTSSSARVELHFGHGTCVLGVEPVDDRACQVSFRIESRGVKQAFVQLPLIVLDGGSVSVAGREIPPAPEGAGAAPVRPGEAVEMTSPLAPGRRVTVTPPKGAECRLRPPVEPLRSYRGLSGAERYRAVYRIALVSCRLDEPADERGEFSIRLA